MAMAAVVFLFVLMGFLPTCPAAERSTAPLSHEEQIRLGERIYREGILPSGEAVQAVVKGDITVPGTSFTCVSCHLRSGLGSSEGGVVTPPTNGAILFKPYNSSYKDVTNDKRYLPSIGQRVAYTDQTLARAIQAGVNPSGLTMNPVMPRYLLDDKDMALLITYLKSLSVDFSPGVSEREINFATVITDDVPPEEYEAMLLPLQRYVNLKNGSINLYRNQKRSERMAASMLVSSELMYKKMTLARWMLKGPAETWRKQLEEYYRTQPVFALLGGISHGDWKPIHDFSEAHHLPCLFPQTEYPVISETDWYTLYLSKGYYQEGEGAARFLNNSDETAPGGKVLQIVRASRESQALAKGFEETWRELGHDAAVTISLQPGEKLLEDTLHNALKTEKPAAILIWDESGAVPVLDLLSSDALRPARVLVSGSQQAQHFGAIPEKVRAFTYITYPYRLPQDDAIYNIYIAPYKKNPTTAGAYDLNLKSSFITTQILTSALMDMRGNYYRDNFFDVIGMMPDQRYPLYERVSFGPGQRYASKGCYIVQLGSGDKPELIKKSDWVIH